MKASLSLLTVLFFFLSANAQKKEHAAEPLKRSSKQSVEKVPQEIFMLEMEGLIYLGKEKGIADVEVLGDTLFISTKSDRKGKCSFKLPLDKTFVIKISRDGYVSKKIKVHTHVPPLHKKNYVFRFEADIFEHIPKLNVSVLDKPVAEIRFNSPMQSFLYDHEYTSKVNKELKKLYNDYYLLEKAMNDSLKK